MLSLLGIKKKKPTKKIKIQTKESIKVNYPNLRPGSLLPQQEINFVYNYAGMGDYIYWTTAIEWAIATHTHLFGTVMAPAFFYDLAKHWLKPYADRFEVKKFRVIDDDKLFKTPNKLFIIPDGLQLINSMGFHLLEVGFHYYANIDKVPQGWYKMPRIEGNEADISWCRMPEKYAVITTEATSPIRKLRASTINGLVDDCLSRGFTPVFLGKKELAHDYGTLSDEKVKTEGVFDLREKTNLLEAAVILAGAQYVVGLDNGLLHLACCSDVPVVMGFNTVDPRHRGPPRVDQSKTIAVVPPATLSCRFCQSHVRFILGHNFHKCLYNDDKCLDLLTPNGFIKAINQLFNPALPG